MDGVPQCLQDSVVIIGGGGGGGGGGSSIQRRGSSIQRPRVEKICENERRK